MEAVPMEDVFLAAAAAGVVIGHDGCSAPLDVADVLPAQCVCDGSGYAEVKMGKRVIARAPCRKCRGDVDG